MNLFIAMVRSAYLAFLIAYTLAVSPLDLFWSGTVTRAVNPVPERVIEKIFVAAWLGIGWIALETVFAWVRVWLDARARRRMPGSTQVSPAAPPPVP